MLLAFGYGLVPSPKIVNYGTSSIKYDCISSNLFRVQTELLQGELGSTLSGVFKNQFRLLGKIKGFDKI